MQIPAPHSFLIWEPEYGFCLDFLQDGIDRGWFRTNRSAINGLPDLTPILATAREIASGMAHLHSLNILHGDLTSLNVLLTSSDIDTRGFVAKVGHKASFLGMISALCSF